MNITLCDPFKNTCVNAYMCMTCIGIHTHRVGKQRVLGDMQVLAVGSLGNKLGEEQVKEEMSLSTLLFDYFDNE